MALCTVECSVLKIEAGMSTPVNTNRAARCQMSKKKTPFCMLHVSTVPEAEFVPRSDYCVAAKGNLHYEGNFGAWQS
jgi:hypothetical protein